MTSITPEQARAYLNRWKRVREAEAGEFCASSMETRMRRLSVLVGSSSLFAKDPNRERGVAEVRGRWAIIRKALDV